MQVQQLDKRMEDDLRFLKRQVEWSGDFLCLMRYEDGTGKSLKDAGGWPQYGFIGREDGYTVQTGNIYAGGDGGQIKYPSAEAILADGWMVD